MTTTAPTLTPSTSTSTSADRVLGILAIAFGIGSVVMGFQPVLAVAGLVLGILSLRRESSGRGLAITGIVTSGVTLLGSSLVAIAALALLPFFAVGAFWS